MWQIWNLMYTWTQRPAFHTAHHNMRERSYWRYLYSPVHVNLLTDYKLTWRNPTNFRQSQYSPGYVYTVLHIYILIRKLSWKLCVRMRNHQISAQIFNIECVLDTAIDSNMRSKLYQFVWVYCDLIMVHNTYYLGVK